MMQLVYFSQKEQFLSDMEGYSGDLIYVTPSPAKADSLRVKLGNFSGDVITIAKFTGNLFKALEQDTDQIEVKRKSELLLIFGILKSNYLPHLGYEQFIQAYNVFSDLRSFTLNFEALTSVVEEQPSEIKEALHFFWKLLEATNFIDEHGAYQRISENLRSAEELPELKKTYVFWGFQHLNGQQVDLLKALAIRYDVIIPFPLSLKNKLKRSDWPSWLMEDRVRIIELPEIKKEVKGKWLNVNSRELGLNLKNHLSENDQVILGVSKLTSLHMDIVPSQKISYKIPHSLVQAEIMELAGEFDQEFRGKNENAKKFEEILKQKRKLLLQQSSESELSYKKLKAIQLYQSLLKTINELTDEEIPVDRFFLKLLEEVALLNQPRTAYVPISESPLSIDLKDMSNLEDISTCKRVIICIDDRFDDIQGLGQNYTESIQKHLSALGPLKRNELELLFKEWEFQEIFASSQCLVMMSDSTLKHSLIWKRLFSGVQLEKINNVQQLEKRSLRDHFQQHQKKVFNGGFSASKFQTFMDCPRKFYFSYVEKLFPQIVLEKDFDSMTAGTIIHEIIESYHKQKWQIDDLAKLVSQTVESYVSKNKLQLPKEVLLQRELIFNHRAINGISFLENLKEMVGEKLEWKMEEEFKLSDGFPLVGKIDCIGISENHLLLIDFKSTKYSAATNTEIEQFENMQLWIYAKAASHKIKDFDKKQITLGFVVLDDTTESNLITSDESLAQKMKSAKLCKQKVFKESFSDIYEQANLKMHSLMLAINSEIVFPAVPRKNTTCHFCELTKVCVKSEIKHG